MHISENHLVSQVEEIRDRFIIPNAHLPERIYAEGIMVVGFADECDVRQSPAFFDVFLSFLQSIGDEYFFFLWLDAPLEGSSAAGSLSVHSLRDCERPSNFVRIQKGVQDEVLSGDTWLVSSLSGLWAIYGEQHGSELVVFMARDHGAAEDVRLAFKQFLVDAVDAANELGDPSETDEGEAFSAQLVQNYQP